MESESFQVLSRVFFIGCFIGVKRTLLWGTMRLLQEQSVIVAQLRFNEGQVRVIRVSKGFCRGGVRGQVRHAVKTCKAVIEDRERL